MRNVLTLGAVLIAAAGSTASIAVVKKVSYPQVNIEVNLVDKPDAAFDSMRSAMAQAVSKKDKSALFSLINQTFIWTQQGHIAGELDLGRDALHNFKVVFGFRAPGNDADGGVENGPFWDLLAAFVADDTFSETGDTGNLVCGPAAAEVTNQAVFEQAREKIERAYDGPNGISRYWKRG
jgi:hypothetical protein